ncbi:enoyl-CoA hydratase [Endozoicomonas sp. (ex Bugula neritina AB1)]|nr:enoyl-CoA hydratase [Endozoicomonas sp. (ex Bugula neritina AB1)]
MSMLSDCETLLTSYRGDVLRVTLNRPKQANAMNLKMVSELMEVMDFIHEHKVRVLILTGAEGNFCAGGDIKDMHDIANDCDALIQLNRAFGLMIEKADQLPCVVITVLQGAVLGGGFGLACISDLAITDHSARFAMPETSLGIIPAQIAPFVVARIGLTAARRLALLGLRIKAEEALSLGLVHQLATSEEDLQYQLEQSVNSALRCAPQATAMTKALLHQVGSTTMEALLNQAAMDFANSALGEGREGMAAFAQKRKPHWQ